MKNERVWRPSLSQAVHLDSVSLADQIVCFQNNKLFDFCSLTLSTLLPDLIRLRKWREMRVVLQWDDKLILIGAYDDALTFYSAARCELICVYWKA